MNADHQSAPKIPGFTIQKRGAYTYHYWMPSPKQRAAGLRHKRLDAEETKARAEAEAINATLAAEDQARENARTKPLPAERPQSAQERALLALNPKSVAYWVKRAKEAYARGDQGDRTREEYDYRFAMILDWGAHFPMDEITPDDVREFRDHLTETRGHTAGNRAVQGLRAIYAKARAVPGTAFGDPTEEIKLLKSTPRVFPWPKDAVPAFVAACDALGLHSMGTALVMNEWLGQRPADMLELPRDLYENGLFTFVQNKTGAVVSPNLVNVPHVMRRIGEELARQEKRGVVPHPEMPLLLRESTGQPWTVSGFSHEFERVRFALSGEPVPAFTMPSRAEMAKLTPSEASLVYYRRRQATVPVADRARLAAAGVKLVASFALDARPNWLAKEIKQRKRQGWNVKTTELVWRALRHTAVLRMVEAGVDLGVIRSVTGHTNIEIILKHYLAASQRAAQSAIDKRQEHEGENVIPLPKKAKA